jgi:hypothetical protein
METAGQLLFVFGLFFTLNDFRQGVSVSYQGLNLKGAVGPVMMILGIFLWWVF